MTMNKYFFTKTFILFVCLAKQALWNLLLLAYYKADFNNFQTHNNENYMTSGLCFKTIHSDHQTKWNAVVQLNCECHLLVHDDTVKYLFLFYRYSHWTENKYKTKGLKCCHLVFLLVRKGNYVSVNHHYGPEAQSTVWVFSSDVTRDQKIGTAGDARLLSSETGLREVTSYDQQENRGRAGRWGPDRFVPHV